MDHVRAVGWPLEMHAWRQRGAPRELDAQDRSAYHRSAGLGKAAEAITAKLLPTILKADTMEVC